jgi:uncharacterized protein
MMPDTTARLNARTPDGKRPHVMYHRWESLLFLHWAVAPNRIQETLPQGLSVDTYDDQAFVGIVPFFMRNVRLLGLPQLPWFSDFQELNVRTYVFDREGIPGIWFYSLDCNQSLAVVGARMLTGLSYFHAEMQAASGEFIYYSCRRNGAGQPAQYRYRGLGAAREADPASLEFFLLERYYLFAIRAGSLIRGQVSHVPYQFRDAETPVTSALPAHWDGFTELNGPAMHQCFVDGLHVRVFGTREVR